jgi:ABC-type Fe3+ transport system substrate-binding protein
MSRFRGQLNRDRTVDVLLVCAIIVSAAIIIVPYILPRPLPEITLHVLTDYDSLITYEMEDAFLTSSYAEDNNIVDIEWVINVRSPWDTLVGSGSIDLIMGPWAIIDDFGPTGLLRPISESILSGVNESIAGVPMKGYSAFQPIWCSYAIRITIFELLANETLLQEYGLTIPETLEDLLSPHYYLDEFNSSLIGMDLPESFSVGYEFRNFITKALGWNNGIQNLTCLYANSQLYYYEGAAFEALLEGEIGITLTMFDGQSWDPLPSTISRTHLENMLVVNPKVVAIANATQNASHSEAFIDYLLSLEGQSMLLVDDSSLLPVSREAFDVLESEVDESIYTEFNWAIRSEGFGVSESYSIEDNTLGVYLDSTALLIHSNLTNSWRNIARAYENGSINEIQFNYFKELLGKPLTIVDPISHVNESFTQDYARRIFPDLYNVDYAIEVTYLWTVAANQRYELVIDELSALI